MKKSGIYVNVRFEVALIQIFGMACGVDTETVNAKIERITKKLARANF